MNTQRLILVTNDDGVEAQGIAALVDVARKFGRVVVVAPKTPQSGMSQAITSATPLFFESLKSDEGVEVYSLSGTPVDCVKFATDHLLINERVDLVLSGINHGTNAGPNVLYSGTMGAAIEGHFYAPSIGFSLDNHSHEADFEASKVYVEKIIEGVLNRDPSEPLCLNVNIPDLPADQIKGIKIARQNRGYWREEFFERKDPRGRDYYWLTGRFINTEKTEKVDDINNIEDDESIKNRAKTENRTNTENVANPENTNRESICSDIAAIESGYVAVVPIKVDMTSYEQITPLAQIFE